MTTQISSTNSKDMTQEMKENAPTGSVFINNSSYAGADIKLVVNIYETGKTTEDRINELREELRKMEMITMDSISLVSEYETKLSNTKVGTPEYERFKNIVNRKRADEESNNKAMTSIADEISRLQGDQPTVSTQVLADVQTISISSNRIKRPVRSLGRVYPYGFIRGQREIAGSLIFTVFNEHVLYQLLQAHPTDFDSTAFTSALLDQLPPMDITISFANEYGQVSRMALYGVEFITEGQTMSIEDILTENVVHYVARDFDPMRSVGKRKIDESSRLMSEWTGTKASDLILEDDYQNVKNMLDPFTRFNNRSDPFL